MSDIESLLRHAIANRITVIDLDTSRTTARAGCWKAFGKYHTAYHDDPIEALRDAIEKALAPPPKPPTDLSDLLS